MLNLDNALSPSHNKLFLSTNPFYAKERFPGPFEEIRDIYTVLAIMKKGQLRESSRTNTS